MVFDENDRPLFTGDQPVMPDDKDCCCGDDCQRCEDTPDGSSVSILLSGMGNPDSGLCFAQFAPADGTYTLDFVDGAFPTSCRWSLSYTIPVFDIEWTIQFQHTATYCEEGPQLTVAFRRGDQIPTLQGAFPLTQDPCTVTSERPATCRGLTWPATKASTFNQLNPCFDNATVTLL